MNNTVTRQDKLRREVKEERKGFLSYRPTLRETVTHKKTPQPKLRGWSGQREPGLSLLAATQRSAQTQETQTHQGEGGGFRHGVAEHHIQGTVNGLGTRDGEAVQLA